MLMGTSRAVIGFWMVHAAATPGMMDESVNGLLELIARKVSCGRLSAAAIRSRMRPKRTKRYAGRGTTGKLILTT